LTAAGVYVLSLKEKQKINMFPGTGVFCIYKGYRRNASTITMGNENVFGPVIGRIP
jgi:hypothetical protein